MAARLSEAPQNKVVLLEAGRDYPPDQTPDDIRDTYSGSALMNPSYFWKNLKVRRRADAEILSARAQRQPEEFPQHGAYQCRGIDDG